MGLIVKRLGDWVLETEILTRSHIGHYICITRNMLNVHVSKWPFALQCQQYPILLYIFFCYAMTTTKIQGNTIDRVGIYW
jgi:hypothetical protein